jgi:hypothetical protein
MRSKIDLIILLILALAALVIWLFNTHDTVIDIQLHDTYYVIDKLALILFTIGPITFLIFLVRASIKRFRSIAANAGLIIGTIMISFIIRMFLMTEIM